MGLFDTECDRAVEQKIGADYNIWLDFGSVQLKVLMLQSRSWIFARIKSTPIPYFSWLLIDISGHGNIFLKQKIYKSLYKVSLAVCNTCIFALYSRNFSKKQGKKSQKSSIYKELRAMDKMNFFTRRCEKVLHLQHYRIYRFYL